MLPSKGFFKDVDCPYYDTVCGRPHCHFKHRRKNEIIDQEIPSTETNSEIPTYKPTPKAELANSKSHIPISYVPDLVIRSDRHLPSIGSYNFNEKPIYKPTPKSILESTSNNKNEYKPVSVSKTLKTNENGDKTETTLENIEIPDLSTEFDMIDEILSDTTKSEHEIEKSSKDEVQDASVVDNKLDVEGEKSVTLQESKSSRSGCHSEQKRQSSKHKKHKNEESNRKSDKSSKSNEEKDKKRHEKESKSSSEKSRHSHKSKSSLDSKTKREKDKRREHSNRNHHKDKRKSSDSNKTSDKYKTKKSVSKTKSAIDDLEEKKEHCSDAYNPCESMIRDANVRDDYFGDDDDDEMNLEEECLRIFNEYKAPPTQSKTDSGSNATNIEQNEIIGNDIEENFIPKKRVAHDNASTQQSTSKINYNKPKQQLSAALVMANRFKLARLSQEVKHTSPFTSNSNLNKRPNESKRDSATEHQKIAKFGKTVEYKKPNTPSTDNNVKKIRTANSINIVDDIIAGRSSMKPKKITPVGNVLSIQREKEKINKLVEQKQSSNQTVPRSITTGAKRLAHTPDSSLADLPDVLHAENSKLPVNIRTRFLTMLADECVKLYISTDDAYSRALNEEYKVYERCSALVTYKNSAMLAVNRIRKQIQERDKIGLGPILFGDEQDLENKPATHGKQLYNVLLEYVLSEEELVLHGYPRESNIPGKAIITKDKSNALNMDYLEENERICCRCHKIYLIDEIGFPLNPEECIYHPLKKRTIRGERVYLCCKSSDDSGCAMSNTHVSEETVDRELEGYQTTMKQIDDNDSRNYSIYALDCEMCYTTKGLELTRVTIVDPDLKIVYESLVKPLNPIIDYNTQFSGIRKEQMDKTSTSILQVQANILHLCNSKTILIGHSLESDMKALKIVHSSVIDTSVMFPHRFGLPHKIALRTLVSDYLKKIIQNQVGGHDSAEDAISCMELVLWKIKETGKYKK